MDWDNLVLNCCVFIAGLFLLRSGSDVFVEHFAIIAGRYHVPETLIILFTSGAEWEVLAIVIASILQESASLGLGNVVGSCIANFLGAFGFGLLVHDYLPRLDTNSIVYTTTLLVFSSLYLFLALTEHLNLSGGIFFLVAFGVYVVAICEAVYDRILSPSPNSILVPPSKSVPEISPRSEDTLDEFQRELHIAIFPSTIQVHNENTPLISTPQPPSTASMPELEIPNPHGPVDHIVKLLIGIFAMAISSWLLIYASSALATIAHLPPTTFGMTFLSIFITLPKKIPIAYSCWGGHSRSLTASTAGSNIFLLTLCQGLLFVVGNRDKTLSTSIHAFEVWIVWLCALGLLLIVFVRGRKWMGGILLGLYIGFVGVEITMGLAKK